MAFFDNLAATSTKKAAAPVASGGFFSTPAPQKQPVVSVKAQPTPSIVPERMPSSTAPVATGSFFSDLFKGEGTFAADTKLGFARNFVAATPKSAYDVLTGIPKTLVQQQINPDEDQKKYEATLLPYAPKDQPILRAVTAPGIFTARQITRFINPALHPLAKDLAEIKAISEKDGIAAQVAEGKLPASILDEFAVLQKTKPQIVGDVAQAVLTAYSGGAGAGTVVKGAEETGIKNLLTAVRHASGEAAKIGTLFGGAQAASADYRGVGKLESILSILSTIGMGTTVGAGIGAGVGAAGPLIAGVFPSLSKSGSQKVGELPKADVGPELKLRVKPTPTAFEGNKDLSLTTLEKLKGRSTVSKQFVSDLTNSPELKQPERDVLRGVLAEYPDGQALPVAEFAEKVKAELLPLKTRTSIAGLAEHEARGKQLTNRYESIVLPDDKRGSVQNYSERIYESPIETSAGNTHFSGSTKSYFGHTRVEDMAQISSGEYRPKYNSEDGVWELVDKDGDPFETVSSESGDRVPAQFDTRLEAKKAAMQTSEKTRRVIEVQSDLYQKGNLEKEVPNYLHPQDYLPDKKEWDRLGKRLSDLNNAVNKNDYTQEISDIYKRMEEITKQAKQARDTTIQSRKSEIAKLAQYNNPTAHFRMVREEIKKAAQDGVTKLQFPTGETAMQIEGLGDRNRWEIKTETSTGEPLIVLATPEDLKVGQEISQQRGDDWIITDILGDGKFKAIPKREVRLQLENDRALFEKYLKPEGGIRNEIDPAIVSKAVGDGIFNGSTLVESFDISGKVDTNNPIYRFYEKDLGRYLEKNYDAKRVTDSQGVSWYEVPIDATKGKEPVAAFRNVAKKLDNPEYDITPKEALEKIRSMFSPDEIRMIHGEDIAPISGITDSRILSEVEGFYSPRSFGADLIGLVERDGKVSSHTLHHEAFHAYLERFVSREERARVLDFIKKEKLTALREIDYDRESYPTPEKRAEEWLADDFARYVREKTADPKLLSFFQRILAKIRTWIRKRGQIDSLYQRILSKDRSVKNRKLAASSMSSFRLGENLPEDLAKRKEEIDIAEEALRNNPASQLGQYAMGRGEFQGKLPEVTGRATSEFGRRGDQIIQELGFDDVEKAREAYLDYKEQKQKLLEKKRQFQVDRVAYYKEKHAEKVAAKDEAALNRMAAQQENRAQKENYTAEKKAALLNSIEEAKKKLASEKAYKERFNKIVQEANRPSFAKDSLYSKLKQSLNPAKFLDPQTFEFFREWRRSLLVGKEIANADAAAFKVPMEEGMKTIHDYQAGRETPYNDQIRSTFDALLKEANDRGFEVKRLENYLPQVYRETPTEIRNAIADYMAKRGIDEAVIKDYLDGVSELTPELAKSLKINPSFSKERVFPSYAAAEAAGLHPKYENPAQLAGYYRQELEKTTANRRFMEQLEHEGKILPSELAPRGWEEIKLTYGGNRWYAESKFAKVINGQIADAQAYGFLDSAVQKVAGISRKAQEIALSAGIPNTSFNFFSIGQLVKQMTAGDFKALVPFLRSNFNEASIRYFEKNADVLKEMAGQGIDLGSRVGSYGTLYDSLAKKWRDGGFRSVIGSAFDKLFNAKTFGSFMPQLYLQTFKDTLLQASKHGLDAAEAAKFAGDTTKALFGIVEDNGRSLKTQDKLTALFFAPRFREGVINTLLNTARSVSSEIRNPMFYKNRRLILGMAVSYAAYNLLNYKLNGNYMWDNENGREFSLKIPLPDGQIAYVEFMPSFLAFGRNLVSGGLNLVKGDWKTAGQKFGQLFSMPIKIASEVLTNSDYFGREIYKDSDTTGQKAIKIGSYIGLSVNHPYIKELVRQLQEKAPLYQSVSNAFELPIKFSSLDKIQQQQFYDALDKQRLERVRETEAFLPAFNKIRELDKEGKTEEAKQRLEALSDEQYALYKTLRATEKRTQAAKSQAAFLPTYNEIRSLVDSGQREEAQQRLDQLSDDEYKYYEALKKKFGGAVVDGTKPQIESGKTAEDEGLIHTVWTYAKAVGLDPVTAFNRIFTGQRIRRVDHGTVIVERMSLDESEAQKSVLGGQGPIMKLDHTIPLELGGSNTEDNLKLVTTEEWARYTPVENYLGRALRAGKLSKREVQSRITRFKAGEITAVEAMAP